MKKIITILIILLLGLILFAGYSLITKNVSSVNDKVFENTNNQPKAPSHLRELGGYTLKKTPESGSGCKNYNPESHRDSDNLNLKSGKICMDVITYDYFNEINSNGYRVSITKYTEGLDIYLDTLNKFSKDAEIEIEYVSTLEPHELSWWSNQNTNISTQKYRVTGDGTNKYDKINLGNDSVNKWFLENYPPIQLN